MKKITSIFFLVSILFLTTTAFAEGDTPNGGGRTCTQNCGRVVNNNEKSVEADTFLPYSLIIKIQNSLRALFG
jgi:hypothetical protein